MKRFLIFFGLLFSGLVGGCASAPEAPPPVAPVRVLIVDGFSNHDWKLTTRLIREILEKDGGFAVTVATCPTPSGSPEWAAWNPGFAGADVVIQNCNDYGNRQSWPPAVRASLEKFVLEGGGMLAFHSANNAFAGWPEYTRMLGLAWRNRDFGSALTFDEAGAPTVIAPGAGAGTSHGARIDALITRLGEHPIHAGLPRRWVAADIEVYSHARGPAEELTALSFAYDPQTGMRWPTEWVVAYGRGRVYTSTFGHVWKGDVNPVSMRCAGERTVLVRATRWLAGRPVEATVPADFPGETKRSLRE